MNPNATVTATELEMRVMGTLLARGDAFHELPANFCPEVFQRPVLRRAFVGVEKLARKGALGADSIDQAVLAAEAGLTDAERSDLVFAEASAGEDSRIRDAANALIDRRRRLEMRQLFSEAAKACGESDAPEDIASRVVARLLDIDRPEAPEVRTERETMLALIDDLEQLKTGKAPVLRTGFDDLDRLVKIRRGNQIILAARPGVGKTTLARQIARNISARGEHVLVHSLEMSSAEMATLDVAAGARIDSQRFWDDSGFSREEWERVLATADKRLGAGDGFLHTNDAHHGLGAICRITEKLHRKLTLSLVVVDYLQLVDVNLGKGSSREREVATITRTLKLLGNRLGLPMLVLSQLNREPEKTVHPKGRGRQQSAADALLPAPKLHHLRESGAIEQDADKVLLLHNPFAESEEPALRQRGPFDLIVAKQRLGKKGRIRLVGDQAFGQFKPFAPTSPGSLTQGDAS